MHEFTFYLILQIDSDFNKVSMNGVPIMGWRKKFVNVFNSITYKATEFLSKKGEPIEPFVLTFLYVPMKTF